MTGGTRVAEGRESSFLAEGRGHRRAALALCVALQACSGLPGDDSPGQGTARAEREASEGSLVAANGTELFVRRVGRGDPVLVIHGGPMLDHGTLYRHLVPLAETHELIFYDQRLNGRSAGRVDSASVRLQTFVDDIDSLRAVLELDAFHLLAHSWGALPALRYAIDHPEPVRALVLVSPIPPSAGLWQREAAALGARIPPADSAAVADARASEEFRARTPAGVAAVLRASFRPQFHDRDRVHDLDLFVPGDYAERSRQFGYLAPDLTGYDVTGDLRRIGAPTLIVYGADEPGLEIAGPVLERLIPEARSVVIPRAGHFSFIEQPEPFQASVAAFLAQHPARPPA